MFGHRAESGRRHYYVCAAASRSGKLVCSASPVERSLIETRVIERLRDVILEDEHVERLVELTNEYLAESHRASRAVQSSSRGTWPHASRSCAPGRTGWLRLGSPPARAQSATRQLRSQSDRRSLSCGT
jgi:hypothetical protein